MARLYYTLFNCLKEKKNVFIFQITENENLNYDQKIGYILRSPSIRDSGEFNCEANRNNNSELLSFSVIINRELVLFLKWCMGIECRKSCKIKFYRITLII